MEEIIKELKLILKKYKFLHGYSWADSDNLKRSLDILERHWQNNCIDLDGNKIEDGTVTPGFAKEYGFIVSNWNKPTKRILKLAKKQDFLQGKVEGSENWAKNHFLGKKF